MLLLSLGIIVITAGAVVVIVGASLAQRQPQDARSTFLRVAASSGAMALGASAMYVIATPMLDGIFSNTAADTALVLSAGLMCVTMATEKERCARAATVLTTVAGVTVAVSSELSSAEVARAILLYALTVLCGSCAVLALRNRVLPRRPVQLIAGGMIFYALHCGARAVALTFFGPATAAPSSPLGFTASLLAAVVTNTAVTIAIVLILVPAARASRRKSQTFCTITISDWDLVSKAYGSVRARQLLSELQSVARDHNPFSVDLRLGVAMTVARPLTVLAPPLLYECGWRPDEFALLVADDEQTPSDVPGQ
ncbi:hypothetical protein [Microbacterium testaceum]|uniref:hypothetical protein n=1 Tax=Microbacterium testaceum TaxID=2033 RepID=UPI00382F704A